MESKEYKAVKATVERLYDIEVHDIRHLTGLDDRNYHIHGRVTESHSYRSPNARKARTEEYVFKVMNARESLLPMYFEAQDEAMNLLTSTGLCCSTPVRNKHGTYMSLEDVSDCFQDTMVPRRIVRLLTFIPGTPLSSIQMSPQRMYDVGRLAGIVQQWLMNFDHAGLSTNASEYSMENAHITIVKHVHYMEDRHFVEVLKLTAKRFEQEIIQQRHKYRESVIHGDLSAQNILATKRVSSRLLVNDINFDHSLGVIRRSKPKLLQMYGLIDFGDSLKGLRLFEISNCIADLLTHSDDWKKSGHFILSGFLDEVPLSDHELQVVPLGVKTRLGQLVVLLTQADVTAGGADEYISRLRNEYYETLQELAQFTDKEILSEWNRGTRTVPLNNK